MKTLVWAIAGMACGIVFGGVSNYVIADVASSGSGNEMLGVAAVEGALFGSLIGGPVFAGIGFWRGRRNRD